MSKNLFLVHILIVISIFAFFDTARAETKTFKYPKIKGYRLDWCLNWTRNCGARAAVAWCKTKEYKTAVYWKKAENIGDQCTTYVMGDGKLCGEKFCDGFEYITCEKSTSADATEQKCTVRGRISGEKKFVDSVAVYSMDGKRLYYSGVVDGNGKYVVEVFPGKYRVVPRAGGKFDVISLPGSKNINCGAGQSHTINFFVKGISEG